MLRQLQLPDGWWVWPRLGTSFANSVYEVPKHLLESIERIVRLVRSRGVGVYFVTQSPSDVPDGVLAQLGNRIQHTRCAPTPRRNSAS